MIRLEMEKHNMILIEKLQEYQSDHQAQLISMSILLVRKYYHLIKNFFNERIGEIYYINKKINSDNLTYHFKGSNTGPIFFIEFRDLF